MECELLQSPMISYRSLLYNTTVLYDTVVREKLIGRNFYVNKFRVNIFIVFNRRL